MEGMHLTLEKEGQKGYTTAPGMNKGQWKYLFSGIAELCGMA